MGVGAGGGSYILRGVGCDTGVGMVGCSNWLMVLVCTDCSLWLSLDMPSSLILVVFYFAPLKMEKLRLRSLLLLLRTAAPTYSKIFLRLERIYSWSTTLMWELSPGCSAGGEVE